MTQVKATNITWHAGSVTRADRAALLRQKGATVWLTGLSGCGKSTIAVLLEQTLIKQGHAAYVLDGDNIRHGLNKNLGFSPEDRTENIRRIGEVAKLFGDAGLLAIASFISPYRRDRDAVRALHDAAGVAFIECHVNTPLEVCEQRDPKGLYKKARAALASGKGLGFTGVDDPYEVPERPELVLRAGDVSAQDCVSEVLAALRSRGLLSA